MKNERQEYDSVATKEDAYFKSKEHGFAQRVASSFVQTCPQTFSLYLVLDRVRYDIEPLVDAQNGLDKSSRYKKISQDWLKVFPLVPRLREVINQLHGNTNEELHDRHRDAGHGEHRCGD
jgi:hypothetical protein